MSASKAAEAPTIAVSNVTADEAEQLRDFSRTPRPYLQHGAEVQQDRSQGTKEWQRQSGQASADGSESGSEADDERSSFVKALPSSTLRPRKGLKTGEPDADTLLTPGQLDEREYELRGYFARPATDADQRASILKKDRDDQDKLQKRRFAEFVRRTSEIALTGVIFVAVLCGRDVASTAWTWRKELLGHVVIIVSLILAYPIKLSIVDTAARHTTLWQRFRVPASFDPATVLYPPVLPVLVALSISPANSAVILPNIILGLASLPQRLFPRSSRLGRFNSVHWLVAIIPLIISEHTAWPNKKNPSSPHLLKTPSALSPETLVTLYPLHHALLQPLQYLSTTSLLVSELHLLSAAIINVLLLAATPQMAILKACLWIGGVSLFVFCTPVLHWNVALARVPKWKFRRPGHNAEKRKSLVDAVSDLISLQRAAHAFGPPRAVESDADEDQPSNLFKNNVNGRARLYSTELAMPPFKTNVITPTSTIIPPPAAARNVLSDKTEATLRPRRNTVPERSRAEISTNIRQIDGSRRRINRPHNILWCLLLTPDQAQRRKWLYAGYIYVTLITVILVPVRSYVSTRALSGQEPIGWAVGYLVGQIPPVHNFVTHFGLDSLILLPNSTGFDWHKIPFTVPLHVDLIRSDLGEANVRLLLIGYWMAVLCVGLLTVFSLTAFVEVDTRRKVFHGVMVAMFVPTAFVDPCFCALALALVLAIFLILEVIRAGQVPPLGNAIGRFVAPYVDGRDLRGPIVVSHIFLLIGCAVPLWFSLASLERTGILPWKNWDLADNRREVAMVSGVICVGMGDAAASLIGRRYGRHKWVWVGGKSLEGSAAFAVAVTIGLMSARVWQVFGGWNGAGLSDRVALGWAHVSTEWLWALLKAVFCACGASFMEAVLTGANDNVVVPVALWLLVKGMRL